MDDNGLFMFAMVLYLIRLLAGRDGRYSKAKYIVVKNKVLVCVLLDDMSIYTRAKRRKSDRNKMTYFGLGLYIAAAVMLLINIVYLIIPKVYTEPWIFETNKDVKRSKKEDKTSLKDACIL